MNLADPLAEKIRRQMVRAISDFDMLAEGDRLMCAVSGGKDSSIMLANLLEIKRRAKFDFSVTAVLLDQKQPGFDCEKFRAWVESLNCQLEVIHEDTYSVVKEKVSEGQTYCSLCSRLRRGILYNYAVKNGYTKIALGHHQDDLCETLLLNIFYSGRIASMPPKLKSDDERNILIRPLSYVPESELIELARIWEFPVIPCNLCGSQDGLQRQQIKELLGRLSLQHPQVRSNILASLKNVRPSQLMDEKLWDFSAIS